MAEHLRTQTQPTAIEVTTKTIKTMPRFIDSWVVNNTMFIYLQGGGACICCAPQPFDLFSPEKEPLDAMIRSLEDLNEDEQNAEIRALKDSPWDEEMRGQVWGDRGLLRFRLKKEMGGYARFFEGMNATTTDDDGDCASLVLKLHEFCKKNMTPQELHDLFQLTRDDLVDLLKTKYKICSFYTIVFCTVAEQLEHFELTGYGGDAPSDSSELSLSELNFERELKFDKTGRRFCINVVTNENKDSINDAVLVRFLQRMVNLAGPTLMTRIDRKDGNRNAPNFRSDRRIIRLLIARCWADKLMKRYAEYKKQ